MSGEKFEPASDEEIATYSQLLKKAEMTYLAKYTNLDDSPFVSPFADEWKLLARLEADRKKIAVLKLQLEESLDIGSAAVHAYDELAAETNRLEAMLVRAAHGHDGPTWEGEGDPADCTQCNYDGMKEVLAEGRKIDKANLSKGNENVRL